MPGTSRDVKTVNICTRPSHEALAAGGTPLCGLSGTGPCNGYPKPGSDYTKLVKSLDIGRGAAAALAEDDVAASKQVGGTHYSSLKHEPFDVIDDWQQTWPPATIFYLANALKYLARLGRKGDRDDLKLDLEKAIHYLESARDRL